MTRDGGAPVASVARHRGRVVESVADRDAANDSSASTDALGRSGDGSHDGADADAA
jgi:hypothetical protein